MEQLNELQKIQEFYKQALESLNNNDYKSATKILYNIPIDLYESSIDILFNRNSNSEDEEFNQVKQLIKEVDDKLVKFSHNKEESPNVNDQFIGDIF